LRTLISENPDCVLIGLQETLGELPINVFSDGLSPSYAVIAFDAPMLMYRRGKWHDKNKLGESALSGQWTTVSADGTTLIDKPAAFVKWGRKVMNWVRKQTPLWHQYERYRITPAVAERIKQGWRLFREFFPAFGLPARDTRFAF
jgi:hypothetical protein